MNRISKLTSLTLAALVIVQGIIEFIMSHAIHTLIIGVVSANLIAVANRISTDDRNSAYLYIAAVSLVLAAYFGINFARSNAFLPHGFLLTLSAATFAAVGLSWLKRAEK